MVAKKYLEFALKYVLLSEVNILVFSIILSFLFQKEKEVFLKIDIFVVVVLPFNLLTFDNEFQDD
jgi:uncharacterized membrane protein